MLDVLDLDAIRRSDEDRKGVGRVHEVDDLDAELFRFGAVDVRGIDEHGEMVEERSLRLTRVALVELDVLPGDLHARLAARRGLRRLEPELEVRVGGGLRIGRVQRDVVEVVLDVGRRLYEDEAEAVVVVLEHHVSVRAPKIRHAKGNAPERAALARAFGREEGELPAPRVASDERERFRTVDHVHAPTRREDVSEAVAIGDPEGDVVE